MPRGHARRRVSVVPEPAPGRVGTPAARPRPVDVVPGERMGAVLALVEQIDRLIVGLAPVLQTVERVTGLPLPQVRLLMALDLQQPFAAPPGDTEHVADLVRRGLVRRTDPPSRPTGDAGSSEEQRWVLTDRGRSALEQVQGLRIRIVDTATSSLDTDRLHAMTASTGLVANALARLPRP